jgi:DNA mismatch repair ATPase MutS
LFARPADSPTAVEADLQVRQARRDNQVMTRLKAIDVDETTPRQALELLAELKKLVEE